MKKKIIFLTTLIYFILNANLITVALEREEVCEITLNNGKIFETKICGGNINIELYGNKIKIVPMDIVSLSRYEIKLRDGNLFKRGKTTNGNIIVLENGVCDRIINLTEINTIRQYITNRSDQKVNNIESKLEEKKDEHNKIQFSQGEDKIITEKNIGEKVEIYKLFGVSERQLSDYIITDIKPEELLNVKYGALLNQLSKTKTFKDSYYLILHAKINSLEFNWNEYISKYDNKFYPANYNELRTKYNKNEFSRKKYQNEMDKMQENIQLKKEKIFQEVDVDYKLAIAISLGKYDFAKERFPLIPFKYSKHHSYYNATNIEFLNIYHTDQLFLNLEAEYAEKLLEKDQGRKIVSIIVWRPYPLKDPKSKQVTRVKRIYGNVKEIYIPIDIDVPASNEISIKESNLFSNNKKTIAQSYDEPVIGLNNSRVFHRPDCIKIKEVKAEDKIKFSSSKEAIDIGAIPCDCKPRSDTPRQGTVQRPGNTTADTTEEAIDKYIDAFKGFFKGFEK